MKPMRDAGILRPNELAVSLHPYRPQAIMRELKDKRFFGSLAMLGKLARAMLYLVSHLPALAF
jgi:ATP-dependent DNA helicase MPH1